MAALVVVAVLVVAGLFVLRANRDDGEVELTAAQREDALLTAGDIGQGFTESTDDDGSDDDEPEGDAGCMEVIDRMQESGGAFGGGDLPPGSAERSFEDGPGSTIEIAITPARDLVGLYGELVAACDELSFSDEESEATFTLDEGARPDVGDESIRLDVTVDAVYQGFSFTIEGAVVAWTRDGNDLLLTYLPTLQDDGTPLVVDERLLDDIIERQDDRLAQVIDEA